MNKNNHQLLTVAGDFSILGIVYYIRYLIRRQLMKALYIILGAWTLITGICTIAGVTELDRVTAGLYVSCLGLMTTCEGIKAWRNK